MVSARALSDCLAAVSARLDDLGDEAVRDSFREALAKIQPASFEGMAAEIPDRTRLPVVRHWAAALEGARAIDLKLGNALGALFPALTWRQNPNYVRHPPSTDFHEFGSRVPRLPSREIGKNSKCCTHVAGPRLRRGSATLGTSPDFLDGYGYAVIAGPGGLFASEIALGVLVLAPGLLYPAHAHPAEEVYLVLDPTSRWWRDGEEWREGAGGAAIHHPPNLAHAMQAGSAPLFAVYLWRGQLEVNAALVPSSASMAPR
ncbi:MAG: dimethylsulfonioproprionate lyase family protein [Rhodospirillales bacterium]|nr:dimethylsulfonioproprionate lyase family protein [Rhodospirillales bacterium]